MYDKYTNNFPNRQINLRNHFWNGLVINDVPVSKYNRPQLLPRNSNVEALVVIML
jgi:hypothetical protein